jgi:hypothetical protein
MPIYQWDGDSWQNINSVWQWDGDSWRQITSGWQWDGDSWRQIFASGTFTPVLRLPGQTDSATARSVGLAIELFKGSTATGTYAYQFQYAIGDQINWNNETIAGSSGNITGSTQTASFTTDSSYTTALEAIAYSGNNTGILDDINTYRLQTAKQAYIRARVIKSGETQFTNNVRIQKRRPVDTGTTLKLQRLSTGIVYTLTGNASTDRLPFVGDTIYWDTPSFQNTTTLTNDTRPDYYWFNFSSNSGNVTRNSILTNPSTPRSPGFSARSYTVQSSDVNSPIVCDLKAVNTNGAGTGDLTITTRSVSDGTLTAPTNLVLSYSGTSGLRGEWDPAGGGNDGTITYTYYLQREVSGTYTQIAAVTTLNSATFFNYATTTTGNYRFYVTAAQSGNPTVTSGFSNIFAVVAPLAFNVSVQNVTNTDTYKPSVFSINAPTLSSTVLNRWIWTWGTSTILGPAYAKTGSFNTTTINSWLSAITYPPGGGSASTFVSSPTDFWGISASGNHTQTVTARNTRKNYVRVSWTKPAGTTASSYSVFISGYFPGAATTPDWNLTINVGDVTFVDIEQDYFATGTNYGNSSVIRVNSVRAFSDSGQTGIETFGTIPGFNFNGADGTTDWSNCNVVGTRETSRVDNLTLEAPTEGTLITSGIPEPGQTLSLTEGSGWSPGYANWTKTSYNWIRSRTVQPVTAGTASTQVVATTSTAVGSEYFCEVVVDYKGTVRTVYSSQADIVPGPPSYSLEDLFNQTFRISSAAANGGTSFFGTYSGASSGTISETLIAGGTFTSPTVNVGNISTTLFSRRYITQVYPNTVNNIQINGTRSTTQSVSIATPPQSTGSRRFLSNAPTISAGNILYISTNGWLGNALMGTNDYDGIGNPGGFLNLAAQDLVLVNCYTKVDNGGVWVRYRGYRYNTPSGPFLEYQVYLTFSGSVYVLFIENGLTDYVANTAYSINGSIQNLWTQSSVDTSSFTVNQGISGWTQRTQTTGSADDGVISFTVIRPARQHQASAVTRTAGGFTFNITNVDDSLFESAATYGVTTTAGTVSINSSTGLVTQIGLTSNQFATVTVSKTRTGYENATNVTAQGQALAGAPPQLVVAPSMSTSGTVESGQAVNRAQVGAVLTQQTGSYNNQQSKTTALLTILSSSYTGADSDWTNLTAITSPVTIGNTAASSSANMYRVRDRVVGTDGSTVDFYSPVYRAVYGPPPGGSFNSATSTSITVNYTGGSGAPRIYRFRDGSQIDFITDPGIGPAVTTFTGLSASTSYSLLLFGGNTEGYLSIGSSGGTYSTSAAGTAPTGGTVSLSPSGTQQAGTTLTASVTAMSGTATITYVTTIRKATGREPVITDTAVASGTGTGNVATHTITAGEASGTPDRFKAFTVGTNSIGSRTIESNTVTSTPAVVTPTPAITSGPGISWASGNNFTLSATASDATNIEFQVQFANTSGGTVQNTATYFMGASAGSRTTGAQTYPWARTRARANNTTTGLSSSFTGYSAWA